MRIPTATYRLQLTSAFGFSHARDVVPYVDALGVSDLYASPIFAARRGSLSGYDVTDPTRLNPELGSESDFEDLSRELRSRTMGLLLDIVPNHMAASHENAWWREVLESGPSSSRASYFDIRWRPIGKAGASRAMLPVLGDLYGRVLERGDLAVAFDGESFVLHYHDAAFPLDPRTWLPLLDAARRELERTGELRPLAAALADLRVEIEGLQEGPPAPERKEALKRRLADIHAGSQEARRAIESALTSVNGRKGDPGTFDRLDELMEAQHYRLAFWKTGMEKLNYRRFFDITDLVGLRIQEPRVFEDAHCLTRRLIEGGKVEGLRIDHIDGLSDPLAYLGRLEDLASEARLKNGGERGIYTVVEKILMPGERLPAGWPVAGTTGYDFLNAVNRVFVMREGFIELERMHASLTGLDQPFEDLVREKKRQVIEEIFPGETRTLAAELGGLAEADRHARDLASADLERALTEMTCSLPVYRTYIATSVPEDDRAMLQAAAADAMRRTGGSTSDAVAFLLEVLLLEGDAARAPETAEAQARFARRWEQYTGPVMAKGLEDTALYSHAALLSLNDVGGRPGADGMSPRSFHDWVLERRALWPHAMNATSTHDTKRSEDVRARIDVLSEMPGVWRTSLKRWMRWNGSKKSEVDGTPVPRPLGEIFYYQTLLGAWPLAREDEGGFQERIEEYAIKVVREAKMETRWTAPHEEYEKALLGFLRRTLDRSGKDGFLDDLSRFASRIAFWGAFNSLGMVLAKTAVPGVPDFYQGTELWDLSLVDPDNRRPVDFRRRKEALAASTGESPPDPEELLSSWTDGRIKLHVIARALAARRAAPRLFADGDYVPLEARGPRSENVLAFARRHAGSWAMAVLPRLVSRMVRPGKLSIPARAWKDTALVLPPGAPETWRNAFLPGREATARAGEIPMADVFAGFPVALHLAE